MFGFFERKEVPPDIKMIYNEIKEIKNQNEILRKIVNLNARLVKLEGSNKEQSLFEDTFGKYLINKLFK